MSALALPHEDNVAYAGPTRGTADELRALIHGSPSHWLGSNSAGTLAAPSSFEVLPPPPPSPPPPSPPPGSLPAAPCTGEGGGSTPAGWECVCCLQPACAHTGSFPALCELRRCCAATATARFEATLAECCHPRGGEGGSTA